MINNELRLEEVVEFDEAYKGGKARNKMTPINEANLARITSKVEARRKYQ
jgi:hypothetical protein